MQSGAWTVGAGGGRGASNVVPLRPRYGPADYATLLWRKRFLMAGVFGAVVLIGLLAALVLKKTYTAESSLLVRLGREYVYNPRVGDAGRGATPQTGDVIQSEMEILGSTEVKARVLRDIGLPRLYPDLARAYERARTPDAQRQVQGEALRRMGASLKAGAAPDTSVVRLSFSARDPVMAATVLNTLVDEYLRQRRQVLTAKDAGPAVAASAAPSRPSSPRPTRPTPISWPPTTSATSTPRRRACRSSTASSSPTATPPRPRSAKRRGGWPRRRRRPRARPPRSACSATWITPPPTSWRR